MERLSSHVSTAKATFSGRSACPVQDSNVTHRNANRQHIRGLQKALRDRLQPESPAAILRLCSHANAHARKGKGSGSRATSTCAALAEPPLEVLEETFPRGNNWEVHKFGGTCVAAAERIRSAAQLIVDEPAQQKMVVVSAMGSHPSSPVKVTDLLLNMVAKASKQNQAFLIDLAALQEKHVETAKLLLGEGRELNSFVSRLLDDMANLKAMLHAISIAGMVTEAFSDFVVGHGELWCAQLFDATLRKMGVNSRFMDTRDVLVVIATSDGNSVDVEYEDSNVRLDRWAQKHGSPAVIVATGFIAKNQAGQVATLKRNGSDYSATIMGALVRSANIVIWTDVDGVFSADPRKVGEAVCLESLSYHEAWELSYFGASVLHPRTTMPAMKYSIPITIRNFFNRSAAGTIISDAQSDVDRTGPVMVKGFATIDNVALINVEGTGMVGVHGTAAAIFGTIRDANCNVVMISQASSEHSVCFAVKQNEGDRAVKALSKRFSEAIGAGRISKVEPDPQLRPCTMALVSFSVVVMAIAAAVASPLLFSSTRPSHVLSDKKTPFIGNGAQQSREPSNGAQLRLQHEDLSRINLLFVLDPNFFLCWETVLIDDSTKDTLLPWAASLKDVFTKSSESPAGLDLALPDRRHVARELRDIEEKTFRQLVGAYLERGSESISLPSNLLLMYMAVTSNCSLGELGLVDPSHAAAQTSLHLTPSRLHVTSEDNFWTAMLRVSSPESSYNDDPEEQTAKASDLLKHLDLKDTVIVLPRVVPQVNDLSPEDFRTDDPRDWNVTMLVGLVEGFLNRTGAATLPSLPEWTTLPDKRRLHDMYQSYYEADPKSRSPPIPTAFLRTPGSRTEQITLCRSGHFASSAAFIDAIMHAIYQGLLRLDAELTHQTSLGAKTERLAVTTEDEDDGTLRHFVIKREFAEGAIMMAMLKFPAAALPEPGQPAPMMYRGDAPWRTRPAIPEYMGEAVTRGGLVTTDPFLKEAAELVASRSCGEGWLLQPKISDMPEMEYRVYLLGGASSTGTAKDTVVIYTPALIDEGIYIANLTVPEGLFWSDIINPPGQEDVNFEGTGGIEYLPDKLNQDRQPWPNQPLHRLIVNAALSGARAMAAHEDGALSSVAHMYARMDVVLGVYWEGGRMFAQPLINEMDWFNSAGVMMRYWPVNSSTEALGEAHGPKLVGPFLREVARRYDASRK